MRDVRREGNAPVAELPVELETSLLRSLGEEGLPGGARWNRGVLIVLGAAVALLVGLFAMGPVLAIDLWWQLKAGGLILQNRAIPHADPFSFTAAGRPWVVQDWLTQVGYYLLYTHVSPEALVFMKGALLAGTFVLLLCRCWLRSGRPLVSVAVTVLAAYAAREFFDLRPQIATFVGLAYLLLAVDTGRLGRSTRVLWTIPPAMLLWANCDGGFTVGLMLLGVETLAAGLEAWLNAAPEDRRWRTLAAVLGASVLAGLLTPNGIQSYLYPFALMAHHGMLEQVGEWHSPDFHQARFRAYELLLIAAITCWRMSSRPRRSADVMLTLGLIYASLYSTRYAPLFALVCAPIIAEHAGSGWAGVQAFLTRRIRAAGSRPVAALAAAALLVALLAGIGHEWRRIPSGSLFAYCTKTAELPRAAVDYLQAHPGSGNLLNSYDWGGYCIFRLYPDQKVFIDSRNEVYFDKGFQDYSTISSMSPGWGNLLDEWQIDTILVPARSGLTRVLPLVGGWQVVYADTQAKILRRSAGAPPAKG